MNKKLAIRLSKIEVTPKMVYEAERLIDRYNKQDDKELLNKKLYVKLPFGYYEVGTFGGFVGSYILIKIKDRKPFSHIPNSHYIQTEIEDVFEKKQKSMKYSHTGVE